MDESFNPVTLNSSVAWHWHFLCHPGFDRCSSRIVKPLHPARVLDFTYEGVRMSTIEGGEPQSIAIHHTIRNDNRRWH